MTKRRLIIIISIAVVLILAAAAVYYFFLKKDPAPEQPPKKFYSLLTGSEVSEELSSRPILGVMIENSEEARPQTGLDSAGIVFEAVTEGGITRFLALYQEDQPEVVGPVRSVRAHFVNWLMGFDASVAHVGGSAEALELLEQRDAKTLNQFTYPNPYYRSEDRAAPHNMYARTELLRDLQQQLEHRKPTFAEFMRSDDAPLETPTAPNIGIDFSSPAFEAEFRYDKPSNSYARFIAGEPHLDTVTNKPISVKNLIVIKAQGLSSGLNSLGSGEALLFKDGNVLKITWKKQQFSNRIQFLDAQQNEVTLNRGSTWIAAIATDRTVSY